METSENNVPYSYSTSGYLKYRIYDQTNTYESGSNKYLQYQNDLRDAINKWDSIISPNSTYFNTAPYNYTHDISIDIDIKDFDVDHDTQMDIYVTNYVYFGFPASYGKTFPTAGKFDIDFEFIDEVKNTIREDGKSSLFYLFVHGVGHLLGIGTFWGANLDNDPVLSTTEDDGSVGYYYKKATNAFSKYTKYYPIDAANFIGLPIEDDGGQGTANYHFEVGFSNTSLVSAEDRYVGEILHKGINMTEVMTAWTKENTLTQYVSEISVGILEDIGYSVDYTKADLAYVGEDVITIPWLTFNLSGYPEISSHVEQVKSILNSIITSTHKDEQDNYVEYVINVGKYNSTNFPNTYENNVLGVADKVSNIYINTSNTGFYELNGVSLHQNVSVIFHEVLHCLGLVGTGRGEAFINHARHVDEDGNVIDEGRRPYATYFGEKGVAGYHALLEANGVDISKLQDQMILMIEDNYAEGTRTYHFEEDSEVHRWIDGVYHYAVKNEMMSGIMNNKNFISSMTLGALEDLGFSVNYNSDQVVDVHTDLIISSPPTSLSYTMSQLQNNTLEADGDGLRANGNTSYSVELGLNVGEYVIDLTDLSYGYYQFNDTVFPASSNTSPNQEIFNEGDSDSATLRLNVTGDFGHLYISAVFGTARKLYFDRSAPRYEKLDLLDNEMSLFGTSDLKVGMTLPASTLYILSDSAARYDESSTETTIDETVPKSFWIDRTSDSGTVNCLVNYTMQNSIFYELGDEVNIPVKVGFNMFGTLSNRFRLSSDNTGINANSLMRYDTTKRGYVPVGYFEILESKQGYFIEATVDGTMKAQIMNKVSLPSF